LKIGITSVRPRTDGESVDPPASDTQVKSI
jgi:hypothetical protein